MTFNDIEIVLSSDISGSSAFGDITNRIISIDKINEKLEENPGEFVLSECNLSIDNFDDWYDNIFKNYFYEDHQVSGSSYTYIHIFLNSSVLWVGYLNKRPLNDTYNYVVEFNFISLIGKYLDNNIIWNSAYDPLTSYYIDNILADSVENIITDYVPALNIDVVKTFNIAGYPSVITLSIFDGLKAFIQANDIPISTLIKGISIIFNCWLYFSEGEFYLKDKLSEASSGAFEITNDIILDIENLDADFRYNNVKVVGNGSNYDNYGDGIYGNIIELNKTLTADAKNYLDSDFIFLIGELSYLANRWWYYLKDEIATDHYTFYFNQLSAKKITVSGLDFWAGKKYIIPNQISEYNYYYCRELNRNIGSRSTELFLFPAV